MYSRGVFQLFLKEGFQKLPHKTLTCCVLSMQVMELKTCFAPSIINGDNASILRSPAFKSMVDSAERKLRSTTRRKGTFSFSEACAG